MITTGCDKCYFLTHNNDRYGCALGQLCTIKDNKVVAPGYCRMCRSHKWQSKQNTTDISQLYNKVLDERILNFDLLIIFDETQNKIDNLKRTIDSDWYKEYAKKIIIADVTGFGKRQNIALQYLKNTKNSTPITVDSSVINELSREETVRRLSKQITAQFFMVIPAGIILKNLDRLAHMIQNIPSRVIHWSFSHIIANTALVPNIFDYGLFITAPYKALIKSIENKSFAEQLRKEEIETKMGLSWFCGDCCAI